MHCVPGPRLEAFPNGLNVVVGAAFLPAQQPLLHDGLGAVEEQDELRLNARLHASQHVGVCQAGETYLPVRLYCQQMSRASQVVMRCSIMPQCAQGLAPLKASKHYVAAPAERKGTAVSAGTCHCTDASLEQR